MARQAPNPDQPPVPLLSLRAAVILALALAAGVVVGALTLWTGVVPPAAVLTGIAAFGGTVRGLHDVIGKR
ncbi:hypothetical protein [Nonomuraea aurantiaca]|uniref:hypothetical protein n=1 Tax=Nonomuraea aurantiaca TaxID=2878562 RepID=UPI001CDA2130|nr:hypothetical protein [Nonomuraea aurantiaca]MCA2229302.1 hypothetical protein [Nonomuraea aurantiaca]